MCSKEVDKNTPTQGANLPRHIAIIMDGNGRWANQRHLPHIAGHRAGVESIRAIVRECTARGVEVLTLFAFSSENWRRPKQEIGLLMDLFLIIMGREVKKLHHKNVCLRFIGERTAFSQKLRRKIAESEEMTCNNSDLVLIIAVNYGGRWDTIQAAKKIVDKVAEGSLSVADITPELFVPHLSLYGLPEPELFIRTGGEQRISNFLLWHLAYTELYFTDILWPDFDGNAFAQAILSFSQRQRRFGRTEEQAGKLPD